MLSVEQVAFKRCTNVDGAGQCLETRKSLLPTAPRSAQDGLTVR